MTDLTRHIQATPLADTHDHQADENVYVEHGPDVLADLMKHYLFQDLATAGASEAAIARALDAGDPDVEARFADIRQAWERCRHTGYGEAARWIAREIYGMDEVTGAGLVAAQDINRDLRRPGQRLHILRERANLSHVQIDDYTRIGARIDPTAPEFYLHDISWLPMAVGNINPDQLSRESGVDVAGLADLGQAMEAIYARYAPIAVAVKSQHAYQRTLFWRERSDGEAGAALEKVLAGKASPEDRLCLGDWCIGRGADLAARHHLPFKIHTGYLAGAGNLDSDPVRAGHLCGLLKRYPKTQFVLMHISYPFFDELLGLAKNFPNAAIDFCWGWAMDPFSAGDCLRRLIHAVPNHKIFIFGGDSSWPNSTLAFAAQARRWFTRALEAEVTEGLMTEKEAIALATRLMNANQAEFFNLAGKQVALLEAAASGAART
ncbi:MAG: amidohydrolase family protein [bacterium]|nr:amidohydrolase family protein [bacterium]